MLLNPSILTKKRFLKPLKTMNEITFLLFKPLMNL